MTQADSKKADFAIVLELPASVERNLARTEIQSINQTEYEPLRYAPIAVSIETKRSLGADDALKSLSIWVSAQISVTRNLLTKVGRPGVQIPPLPVLLVLVHDWELAIMESVADRDHSIVRLSFLFLVVSTTPALIY